jgi:hypothetical protein
MSVIWLQYIRHLTYHDNKIGYCAHEDAERSPDLPGHDKTTANISRYVLCGEDRDGPNLALATKNLLPDGYGHLHFF